MIVSSDHKITMVNPALQNLLGYSRDELLGKTWQEITAPEYLERCSQLVNELIMVDKEMFTIEKQYHHKNGSQIDVRCFIRHVDHPSPDSFLVIIQDISDEIKLLEKESQLNLQQSEIDHKNRELTSYTLYLSQKNQLLTSISDALTKLSSTDQRLMREQIQKLQNYITKNISREEDWDAFIAHFREVNPNFLDKLSERYPKLTQKELKHCAYVRMRLSINDVADLLHISPKAVEVARYRIKKKMGLKGRHQRLSDVLERFN
jgi:PAS domain S-box-containing protein